MAPGNIDFYRRSIDKLVSREKRVNILAVLGATQRIEGKVHNRINPHARGLAKKLLGAIKDFDVACVRGRTGDINTTGQVLGATWIEAKTAARIR